MKRFLAAVERRLLTEREEAITTTRFRALPVGRKERVPLVPTPPSEHDIVMRRRAARIAELRGEGLRLSQIAALTGLTEKQITYAEHCAEERARVAQRREVARGR